MTWNLSSYSLPQLKQLRARVAKEIVKQEAAIKATTLKRFQRLAREHGLSLKEVLGDAATATPRKATAAKSVPAPKPALPPKYRHPSNSELAWSGRGRKPHWVEAWLANGGTLDALATAALKFERKKPRKTEPSPATAGPDAVTPASVPSAPDPVLATE